ncbi:BZ3500_MvSof-1268-A1-R1_Chr1-2g01324 [Microbotryum saponariae]|uniref:BZ3500_MvSof-1268-A1-R1_Chr1-2g01324 protein n=1 Tax=Microbotryum saponariae TaxID=289078 RepID=A0A2X0KSN1_9BASI|nr:BZ3500_MvSof-1268-A1-R1_Chr1-2g01324 [Microbotryum saponariae]SCZ97099.1 BZ3501_MvSof-1269-A2-R1_Chr1-2g00923 [Microbotryum saponariae]
MCTTVGRYDFPRNSGFNKANGACVATPAASSSAAVASTAFITYAGGVIHGVPGKCSDYTGKKPAKATAKACSDSQAW